LNLLLNTSSLTLPPSSLLFPFLTCGYGACYTVELFRFAFRSFYVLKPKPAGRRLGKAYTHLVTEETIELELESRIESIAHAAEVAAKVVGRLGLGDEAAFGVDMAVREAVTNAVLHGNKQDEAKKVEVNFRGSREMLEITVRDRGNGFDLDTVPDPTDPQNLLKASGRGILFMRTFMDDVEYSRHPEGGTVVRMTKRK
jgi:serine/threonine-protein kinase RsbW